MIICNKLTLKNTCDKLNRLKVFPVYFTFIKEEPLQKITILGTVGKSKGNELPLKGVGALP